MGVQHSRQEVHQEVHRFGGFGQNIGDLFKAIHVATEHAKSLGVDTSYDDWATVIAESGEHWVEFTAPIAAEDTDD